jgi:hypothetical protein
MPARVPLFHAIHDHIATLCPTLRPASMERLALLVTGIVAARSCVLARIASELAALELTAATCTESIERRLRRTLNDPHLDATCYHPLVSTLIDWSALVAQTGRILLIVDESSQRDHIHLFRVSLAYRGTALPLAWAVWQQNVPLPKGTYWQEADAVLAQVAALLPVGVEVLVLADRAYDIPPFIDRLTARGWHWLIRCKAESAIRLRDHQGTEHILADLIAAHLAPGRRWKLRGWLFKDAGWREASVVGLWSRREDEPLVVISDLPPRWDLLGWYGRRFWCEPSFRTDKRKGWQWEACQVQGVAHHRCLLLGMAWASILTVLAGVEEARARLARPVQHRHFTQPQHSRLSLFSLGLGRVRRWLYQRTAPATWRLTDFLDRSWNDQWLMHQRRHFLASPVRP